MNATIQFVHLITIIVIVVSIALAIGNRDNFGRNSRPCNTTADVVRNVSGESTFAGKEGSYAGD